MFTDIGKCVLKIRYCCQHYIADHVFIYVTEIGNILMFHDKTEIFNLEIINLDYNESLNKKQIEIKNNYMVIDKIRFATVSNFELQLR